VPDRRMLWNGTAVMRFADFPTIYSALSNAAEHRRQSRHVFGVPMETRTSMTRRDGASELPQSNERRFCMACDWLTAGRVPKRRSRSACVGQA
jgi:hypothetical protein